MEAVIMIAAVVFILAVLWASGIDNNDHTDTGGWMDWD